MKKNYKPFKYDEGLSESGFKSQFVKNDTSINLWQLNNYLETKKLTNGKILKIWSVNAKPIHSLLNMQPLYQMAVLKQMCFLLQLF